jgi:hypothetical protein
MGQGDDLAARACSLREQARKARYIAIGLNREDDRERLQHCANELDDQAAKLETSLASPQPPVTRDQQQVQQQKAEGPVDEKGN